MTSDTLAGQWPSWLVPARAAVEWADLCRGLDELGEDPPCADAPERWWSMQPRDIAWARAVCVRCCPLVELCRAYAAAAGERKGIWGGLAPAERRPGSGGRDG